MGEGEDCEEAKEEEEEQKESVEANVTATTMHNKGVLEVHKDVKRGEGGGIGVEEEEETMYYFDRH